MNIPPRPTIRHPATQFYGRRSRCAPFFVLIIALLLAACSGLAGEPEIVSTLPPATETTDLGYPEAAPDLARGAQLYTEHCTRCHGPNGAGNGELVLTGEVSNPGSFADPETLERKTPFDYFETITNGRLETLMPPFGDALTEEERWAVALYVYTLPYSPERLDSGAEVYASECADCHGEEGLGDGPEAAELTRDVGNLAEPETMVFLSDRNLYTLVNEGAGDEMPAYADILSEEEQRAALAYTRSLSLRNTEQVAQALTPTPDAESTPPETQDITGQIINGTEDATVSDELTVVLHIIDSELNEETQETRTDTEGRYTFTDVPIRDDRFYLVTTQYRQRNFGNALDPLAPELEVPITIYEPTDDSSVISITRAVTQIRGSGDLLEVQYEIHFRNDSDRAYSTNREFENERFASVEVSLPVGAVVVGNDSRFVVDEEDFTLFDTRPVLPGREHIVQVFYLLPYENGAVIEYPVSYSLNGPVLVVIDTDSITASSEQLDPIDAEAVAGLEAQAYGSNLTLASGDLIRYELRGSPPGVGTSQDPTVITSDNLLPIAVGFVAAVVVIAIGAVVIYRRRTQPEVQRSHLIDGLVRQIADLDAQHDQGQINHDLYHRRREQLKARLAELMETNDAQTPDD